MVSIEGKAPFYSDPRQIDSVLNTIISNVLIYRVRQREHIVGVELTINKNETVLIVKDNGTGIQESVLQKINTMFLRKTSLINGVGQGLYTIKRILNDLHGKINFHSELNIGTTVTILFSTHD